jgi:hypothetical protein
MLPDTETRPEIHKTGHRRTDLIVASSAIFISVCSLALAIHQGHTMERLVEANSRPFLQFDTSNGQLRANGELVRELSAAVSNPGTGAARIERFSIALEGHLVGDWPDVLQRLKQEAVAKHVLASERVAIGQISYATVAPSYLKGGGEQIILQWARTEENGDLWDYAESARQARRITLEACYCSIFDQCWVASTKSFRPTAVKKCN